jgi:hypothetical protein
VELFQPYLSEYRPELLGQCCYAVGSSVAYGLADEYSDIDTLLVLPEAELDARPKEWSDWSYMNRDVIAFNKRHGVRLNVKPTTWRNVGASVLFGGPGAWQEYYEGHHFFVSTLILIHDPQGYGEHIRSVKDRMPPGMAELAAERYIGELASLAAAMAELQDEPRFVGLFAYSIVARALPLLFHRAKHPLPFHKWQWPLAERLGDEARTTLSQLRALLERQAVGDVPFPRNLFPERKSPAPWRVPPVGVPEAIPELPVSAPLPPELLSQMLDSVQWHLEERGCYQMVRALARGWRHEALYYLCATRCMLIKGTVLLETGRLPLGKELPEAWPKAGAAVPGLERCLWPDEQQEAVAKAVEGIGLFRAELRRRKALPELHLDRPLWSTPSYHLACLLEEP